MSESPIDRWRLKKLKMRSLATFQLTNTQQDADRILNRYAIVSFQQALKLISAKPDLNDSEFREMLHFIEEV